MKNLLYLLMILPFLVKAQSKDTAYNFFLDELQNEKTTAICIPIGSAPIRMLTTRPEWKIDTVKVVMLVSDTSEVQIGRNIIIGSIYGPIGGYQDTRPFMMYGYQTSTGELLDAYKQKLSKNIVMWIAYKTN